MRLIAIALCCVLSACSAKPVSEYHPPRPVAITTFNPDFKVIVVDDKPYVAMSYDDNVQFRIWLEKVRAYIETQNNMLCVYRKNLKEPVCIDSESISNKK